MTDFLYQNRIRLDPSWPGVRAPAEEVTVDPDTLERLGRLLVGHASGLASDQSHLPTGVSYFDDSRRSTTVGLRQATESSQGSHWFGEWPTAVLMEHSLTTAGANLAYYYERLVEQVAAAGHLFRATSDDYRAVEAGAMANLEAHAAGWDRLAAPIEAPAGQPAGEFRQTSPVPYINEYEDVSEYDPDWVLAEVEKLRSAQPWGRIQSVADTFDATTERLTSLATMLRGQAEALAAEWDSETSAACQRALQRITATAEHLAESAQQLADFSHRSAEVLQEAVSGFPTEVEGRDVREWLADAVTPGEDPHREEKINEVRDALARLNDSYRTVNYTTLPGEIGAHLPLLPDPGEGIRPPSPPPPAVDRPLLPTPPRTSPPFSEGVVAGPGAGTGLPVGAGITGFPAAGAAGGPDLAADEPPGPAGGLAGAAAVPSPGGPPGGGGAGIGTGVGAGTTPAGPTAGGPGSLPGGVGSGGVGLVPGNASSGTGRSATSSGSAGRGAAGSRPGTGAVTGVAPVGGTGGGTGGSGGTGRRHGTGPQGRGDGGSGSNSGAGASGRPAARPGTPGPGILPTANPRGSAREDPDRRPDGWLTEDDDPWQSNEDPPPPPVIR